MVEEKQENMSMDEILSSIKNILSEGSETSSENEATSMSDVETTVMNIGVPDTSSVDLALDETDDGVLDLTEDMRVMTDSPSVVNDTSLPSEENIDISDELLNVGFSEEIEPTIEMNTSEDIEPEVISEPTISFPEDIASDPIYTPEEDDETLSLGEVDILSDTPDVASVTNDFNVETILEPYIAEEPKNIEPEVISEPTENNVDTTDVSASIINNFAKIFADNQEEKVVAQMPKVSSSIKLGEDATLSDIVKSSIRDMIAQDMIMNIVSQTDIKSLATAEVSEQVKSWLNANLPSMVEAIVKKEIERVMVKAGKN